MIFSENNKILWIWLSNICSPGGALGDALLDLFDGSVERIYEAGEKEYSEVPRLLKKTLDRLLDKSLDEAEGIYKYCQSEGIGIVTPDSPLYPSRLLRIQRKPLVLYYKGVLKDLDPEVCIAMVGTRSMSEYGKNSAYSLAFDLASAGAAVVSGMARGIDGMAHRGALDAGGYTVAVLGCGIDRAYPPEHKDLMDQIISRGAVITEYKPGTGPLGSNFPTRNRIISGLSQGTLVVEAPKGSGALITAKDAIAQGRDVFALPGNIGMRNSDGVNDLIKDGAKIVTCAADVLLEYQPLYSNKIDLNKISSLKIRRYQGEVKEKVAANIPKSFSPDTVIETVEEQKVQKVERSFSPPSTEGLSPDEARVVLAFTTPDPLSSDRIAQITGLGIADVLSAITMLEISGVLTALPGGSYMLNTRS